MSLSEAIFISALSNAKSNANECIQVYDLKTTTSLKGYRGLNVGQNSLNVLDDNYVVASYKDRPSLQVWQINKNSIIEKKFPIPRKANVVAITKDLPYICAIGIEEQIHIYCMLSGRQLGVISEHYQTVSCLEFTDCSQYFASAGNDGYVYLWRVQSIYQALNKGDDSVIRPYYKLGKHCDKVTGIAISTQAHNGCLVSCSVDFTVKINCLQSGELTHNIVTSLSLTCITLNTVGTLAYLGSKCGRILMIKLIPIEETRDVQNNDEGTPAHESAVTCIKTNGLANTVATGGADGEVKLWKVSFDLPTNRKHFYKCQFHYFKSVVVGRGCITNIKIISMDFSVLQKLDLEPSRNVASFINNSDEHPLQTEFIKKRSIHVENLFDKNEAVADVAALDLIASLDALISTQGS